MDNNTQRITLWTMPLQWLKCKIDFLKLGWHTDRSLRAISIKANGDVIFRGENIQKKWNEIMGEDTEDVHLAWQSRENVPE